MNEIISQTENGQVFRCPTCRLIHFEYKNLNFNFTDKEYQYFANYFLNLDGEYWEIKNGNTFFRRKIFIPAGMKDFNILINNKELKELKRLLSKRYKKSEIPIPLLKTSFSNN
ncbi:MAG TPA: hypothetical protein DDZ39_13100 [Flavobacteriaceae bacterium]|jgi:hypothetical protein|nr:hypothetical protein [Flavobacteriaceae bacterium]HBS12938.1 hypothetical protein [Flavobacteriaceae bacterium]